MNKKLKKVLASLLLVCSVGVTTACGKDKTKVPENSEVYQIYLMAVDAGATDLTYEEWLALIKGEKGDTGAQGPQGEKGETGAQGPQGEKGDKGDNGATWLSGKDKPSEDKGNVNDFYLDTLNKDIYKKTSEGWVLQFSIDDDKEGLELEAGLYVSVNETSEVSSYLEIELDEDKEIVSVNLKETGKVPNGTSVVDYFGAVPTAINDKIITLDFTGTLEGISLDDLAEANDYVINQRVEITGMNFYLHGTVNQKLEAANLYYEAKTDITEDASYEVVDEVLKFYIGGTYDFSYYFQVGEEFVYNGENAINIIEIPYIEKQYRPVVFGTYKSSYDLSKSVTISEEKVMFRYEDQTYVGDYEIEDFNIEYGMNIVVENETAKYKIYLNLYSRECYFSEVTYNYVGEYTATIDEEEVEVEISKDGYGEYNVVVGNSLVQVVSKEYDVEEGIKIFDLALSNGTSTRIMLFNAKTREAHNLKPKTLPFIGLVEYAEDDESMQYYFVESESGSNVYSLPNCLSTTLKGYEMNIDYDSETVTIYHEDNAYENISFAGWNNAEDPQNVFTQTFENVKEEVIVKVTITLDTTTRELSSVNFQETTPIEAGGIELGGDLSVEDII